MTPRLFGRFMRVATVFAVAALAAGCTDFLKATNPSAIDAKDLENPLYVNLMVNGVIGEYQQAVDDYNLRTGTFGDELFNNHGFFEEREIDKRNVDLGNGTYPLVLYVPLQRSRFLADSVAGRLKVIFADSASRDLRVARVLAYAGYSYVLLAESLCSIPVNGSVPLTPEDLTKTFSVPRFNEAIAVASAYRAATSIPAQQAAADSVINFARVGAARALLYVNDKARARTFAEQVPAAFEFRSFYSAQNGRENNAFFLATVSSPYVSLEPGYKRLNDPRVPHPVLPQGAQSTAQGNTDTVTVGAIRTIGVFVPNAGRMFSQFDNTVIGADVALDGFIRIATGLEAQYIVAEADGPTAATLAFVNARRASGNQTPVVLAGDALMAEFRDQRRRDLFLDGHWLGDMRRYLKYLQLDLFPRGRYPGTVTSETYNDATCFPLPLSELAGNPNVPR